MSTCWWGVGKEAEAQLLDDGRQIATVKTVVFNDVADFRTRVELFEDVQLEHRFAAGYRRRRRGAATTPGAVRGRRQQRDADDQDRYRNTTGARRPRLPVIIPHHDDVIASARHSASPNSLHWWYTQGSITITYSFIRSWHDATIRMEEWDV